MKIKIYNIHWDTSIKEQIATKANLINDILDLNKQNNRHSKSYFHHGQSSEFVIINTFTPEGFSETGHFMHLSSHVFRSQ